MSVLVVRVAADDADSCSDWLFQLGANAIEERTEPAGDRPAAVTLVAGFGDDDLALAARSVLNARWPCRIEDTGDEVTWRDEWLRWLEPIEAAGFVIHAPWHDPQLLSPGLARVSIDPGRAFGSGHHPTTRLALDALRTHVARRSRVLDVGCGTGILSIAAARLGAASVLGLDLDHDIVSVAEANLEANGVASVVELSTIAAADLNDRFDVVVANIVIGEMRPLLIDLVHRTEGVLIISGFLEDQLDSLLAGLAGAADVGVDVVERSGLEGWGCAVLRPRGDSDG